MQLQSRQQHGFSLIELLIVIIIIAVLAAIAIPMYLGQRSNAKDATVKEGVHALQIGLVSYAADNNGALPPSGNLDALKSGYLDPWPRDAFGGGAMGYSSTPSAGSYAYVSDGTSFTLVGWLSGGTFRLPGDVTLADASPAADTTSFTTVSSDLVARLLDYYAKYHRWPSSKSTRPYTDLGLDPADYASPVGNVTYKLTGSQIVATPASGYVMTVTAASGKTRTITSSKGSSSLIYDASSGNWYYGSVRSSNKVDIGTLSVSQP